MNIIILYNMRIREVGCDESIVLSKFKFNCDEIDKSIPDPFPQNLNHFLMIVSTERLAVAPVGVVGAPYSAFVV